MTNLPIKAQCFFEFMTKTKDVLQHNDNQYMKFI
jgi:hypothetical protein